MGWRSFEFEENPDHKTGIPLTSEILNHPLPYATPDNLLADAEERFLRNPVGEAYAKEWCGDENGNGWREEWHRTPWTERWLRIPYDILAAEFSVGELCQLKMSTIIMSDVSERFAHDPRLRVVSKLWNALWHWSHGRYDYNDLVWWYRALRQFRFSDDPAFEVRLDHASYYNPYGYMQHSRMWTDAAFCYLVHHKGKPVMKIGVSPSTQGLHICQIQLVEKKRNRWLYGLRNPATGQPVDYVDYVMVRLSEAFRGCPLYIATGESTMDFIVAVHDKENLPPDYRKEHAPRLKKIYSRRHYGYGATRLVRATEWHEGKDRDRTPVERKGRKFQQYVLAEYKPGHRWAAVGVGDKSL